MELSSHAFSPPTMNVPCRRLLRSAPLLAAALLLGLAQAAHGQSAEKTAEEFVRAATAGGPAAALPLYHPKEMARVHDKIMLVVEREAESGGKTVRSILFGGGPSVEDLRHMTHETMLLAIIARLPPPKTFNYDEIKALGTIKEGDNVHVVVRASLSKVERLKRRSIVSLVSLEPYGKDWRVIVPSSIEARVDDVLAAGPQDEPNEAAPAAPVLQDPGWKELLTRGIGILQRGQCEEYFEQIMAPSFRRSLTAKAYDTIVKSCENNNQGSRDKFRTGLELARDRVPSVEGDGSKVVYDLSQEALPFERLVLVRIAGRWYVAE
jgi:hypothetical protein